MKAPSWKLAGDVTQVTWKLDTSSGSQRGFALTCPDATTCYLEDLQVDASSGPAPTLVEVTHDGGTTWQRSSLPGDIMPTTGIDCVDADTCFAGGQDPSGNNEIVTTDDGGQSWTVLPMSLQFPSPFQFADISCVTTTSCVAVGTSGGFADGPSSAVITTNGGRSWTTSDFPTAFVPSKVRCVTGGTCLTVGYEGQASAVGASFTAPTGARPGRLRLCLRGSALLPPSGAAATARTVSRWPFNNAGIAAGFERPDQHRRRSDLG